MKEKIKMGLGIIIIKDQGMKRLNGVIEKLWGLLMGTRNGRMKKEIAETNGRKNL